MYQFENNKLSERLRKGKIMNTRNNPASKTLAVLVQKASVVNNENGMSTIEYAMGYLLFHD